MNLETLLHRIRALRPYQDLLQRPPSTPLGLPPELRAPIAAALASDRGGFTLLLVPRRDRLLTLAEELRAWAPDLRLLPFPDPNALFYEVAPWGERTLRERLATLAALTEPLQPSAQRPTPPPTLILATARAAMTRTLPPRLFLAESRWLRPGQEVPLQRLLERLVAIGYRPVTTVTEPGEFARRGGILDLWPPAEPGPARVEFFGDEVDSLRRFDPATQRSLDPLERLRVTPAREALPVHYDPTWDQWLPEPQDDPLSAREAFLEAFLAWMYPEPTGLLDYLPADCLVLFDDLLSWENTIDDLEEQALELERERIRSGRWPEDMPRPYLSLTEIRETLEALPTLDMGVLGMGEGQAHPLAEAFALGPRFGGQVRPLLDHLHQARRRHEAVVVVSRQAPRLAELWSEDSGDPAPALERLPEVAPGQVAFLQGALAEGWVLSEAGERIHLLTDAEIFGWSRPRPRARRRPPASAPEAPYADLSPGDYVVHVDFGIGRFRGLVERTVDGVPREFLLIEYAEGDQLYVPVAQADRVSRYIGVDARPPRLTRLGGADWERAKSQARRAVEEIARDLLDLYARRMTARGHAFSPDTDWQRELEASFPYMETEDQRRAIEEVKRDMESPRPMDRLICGDAGYGKTEVALRAAFKAVMDGKQVAMLVPTTVLAQQHFHTFRQRLAAFPVEVEMLSRFRTPAETKDILERLAVGEIDIVIGTHRLLQKDVRFKDLGLLIIDEEQRFGVTHKEHFKRLRTEIDVLTLTATPIPRTLYLALTGARDISTINTPPEERLPVITQVAAYDPQLIRRAILRELDRGGQVFFVHNRVQTIETVRRRLERLVPEARIAVAHGQMPERELAEVMERFTAGEVDVLVCTTIIESGLDIPNANTLIVDRADHFGLAQLYQLRGRVGRGALRAFAYFLHGARGRATPEALERLETIATHTEFGSGFAIAMRDLELRGAGDILGTRQHGHIAAIGFHLYTRLLAEAIRRLRADRPAPPALPTQMEPLAVSVDLPLPATIPADYVPDRDLRLQLYRRLANLRTERDLEAFALELQDRFGPVPEPVHNLLYLLRVKLLAAQAGVRAISTQGGQVLLESEGDWLPEEGISLGPDVRRSKRGLWLNLRHRPDWRARLVALLEDLAERREKPPRTPALAAG